MTQRTQNQKISGLLNKIITDEIPSINENFNALNIKINTLFSEEKSTESNIQSSVKFIVDNIKDIKESLKNINIKVDKKVDIKLFSTIITLVVTLFVAWLSVITVIAAK